MAVRAEASLAEGEPLTLDVGALVAQNRCELPARTPRRASACAPTRRWSTALQPLPPLFAAAAPQIRRALETQAQLEASQAAYEELCVEHRKLQEQQLHQEREGYEVAALFRREMLAKSGELVALEAEVALGAAALQAAATAATQREAQLQAGFAAERQQLVGAAAALQEQLDGLAEFRQHKEGFEGHLLRLQAEGTRAAEEAAEKVRTGAGTALYTADLRQLPLAGSPAGIRTTTAAAAPTTAAMRVQLWLSLCRCWRCSGGCSSWRAPPRQPQLLARGEGMPSRS